MKTSSNNAYKVKKNKLDIYLFYFTGLYEKYYANQLRLLKTFFIYRNNNEPLVKDVLSVCFERDMKKEISRF